MNPHTSQTVTTTTPNLAEEQKERLRELFPEVFTEGKIDWDKLRATLGETVTDRPDRYQFTWAGKQDAIRLLQMPTSATLIPDREASVNWDETQNIFIEGDNLEVLKLLYKPYFGRVKMIYIDPPYNTGGDFIYPDNYADPLDTYLRLTGQKNGNGDYQSSDDIAGEGKNSVSSGRYHSTWLSMMYPRLFLARQLLREDGAIFVSIDDNEFHNLRMLMNEIFGEENFIATIIWEKKYAPQNDATWLSPNHDYIILYARNKDIWRPNLLPRTEASDQRYSNMDNDPRGPWKSSDFSVRTYISSNDYPITTPSGRTVYPPEGRCWVVSPKRYEELLADNRIWFGQEGNNVPAQKKFLSEVKQGLTSLTIWTRNEVGDTQDARRTIKELFGSSNVFDTPKSVGLIKKMLQLATNPKDEDIVLDFFSGSGTTAHAVIDQNTADDGNRRFLMVQLPELIYGLEYSTIAEVGRQRINRVIKEINLEYEVKELQDTLPLKYPDYGYRAYRLGESCFRLWKGISEQSSEDYTKQLDLFVSSLIDDSSIETIITEVALKEGFSMNSRILEGDSGEISKLPLKNDALYKVEDLDSGRYFYVILAEKILLEKLESLSLPRESLLVCRDLGLDDSTAANLSLNYHLKTI